MGEPVAAGTELNRIHRPRFPGVLFGIAVALTLSGIFMQYILYGSEPLNTTYSNTVFMQHAVFYQVIGFSIILFGMFSNYMCLSKIQLVFIRSVFGIRAARLLLSGHVLFLAKPVPLAIICVCCIHCPMHCCYTQPEKGWKIIIWLHVLSLLFSERSAHTNGFCMAAGSGICFSVRPAVRNLYPKKDSARFQKGSLVLDTSSLYRNRSFGRQPVFTSANLSV